MILVTDLRGGPEDNIGMVELYAIGHITEDVQPEAHLGGAVSYSAVSAVRLGMRSCIVTKAPRDHPYIDELKQLGVEIELLPVADQDKRENITTFNNFYDDDGHRKQFAYNIQEDILAKELAPILKTIPEGSIMLAAPILDEVKLEAFPLLAKKRRLIITPQGYFRKVGKNGEIKRHPWNKLSSLRPAELIILSEEDITFNGEMDDNYLQRLRDICSQVVLTQGSNGLTVFRSGQSPKHIAGYSMHGNEIISPTGAGDSCAAALIWSYLKCDNLREAGVFGAFYPALKLMGIGGGRRGVEALPNLKQVVAYIEGNQARVQDFLALNKLPFAKFMAQLEPEGINV